MVEFTEWPERPEADFAIYPPREEEGMKLTHIITIQNNRINCTNCHVTRYWKLAIYIHEHFFCCVSCVNKWAKRNAKTRIE